MTSVAEDALRQKASEDINMIELYNAQFPDDKTTTSAELNKALEAVEPAVTKVLKKIGAEFAAMTVFCATPCYPNRHFCLYRLTSKRRWS